MTSGKKPNGSDSPRNGAALLACTLEFIGRFVAYPSEYARLAHALWLVHTHLMEVWDSTPRLAFLSPEPGSGKTRALEVSELLVPRPIEAINATPAYLFRKVSDRDGLPTVLFDEIDTLFGAKAREHEEVRAIINAGHRRGAKAGRCVVKGKTIVTEELPAYCAVAIAGLGRLPDTILSRSIPIGMRPRAPTEHVVPFRRREALAEGHALRDALGEWAHTIAPRITWPVMPENVTDRAADVWEPLLAIADAAGGDWPEKAREAAVALVSEAKRRTFSLGVRLLGDIRRVFGDRVAMRTAELIEALCEIEDAPWSDLRGTRLNSTRLAKLLSEYDIAPKVIRFGGSLGRGYERADLFDAWARYLPPPSPSEGVTPATSVTLVTPVTPVTPAEREGRREWWQD